MTKAAAIALLACVELAGCAVRDGWTKPGMTEQDRKEALYVCERDARITDGGWSMFRRCMDMKGYTQEK